jgi:hypothetical protein
MRSGGQACEVIEVPTNSDAITGEAGSSKSSLSCDTLKQCTSPPITTGFATFFDLKVSRSRSRAAG